MGVKRFLPLILLFGILAATIFSCQRDPWTYTDSPTDVVSITKTTRFAKSEDGSPMKSNVGAVKMSHKTHGKEGLQCVQCHHREGNDERIKTCAAEGCHVGGKGYGDLHNLCLGCHIEKKEGPQKCKNCH